MRVLALETATAGAGLALFSGERLIDAIALGAERAISERLLPALEALLARTGTAPEAIDGYAISIGPGSFTGLRVGLASVKGLAFGSETPVAPVPTLAALAAGVAAGPVAALLDARRGEVYAAVYAAPGDLVPSCVAEGVYPVEALAERLGPGVRVVGEGACLHRGLLEARGLAVAGAERAYPSAEDVGRLGVRMLAAGGGVAAAGLAPRYLRRAEAEARRVGRALEP